MALTAKLSNSLPRHELHIQLFSKLLNINSFTRGSSLLVLSILVRSVLCFFIYGSDCSAFLEARKRNKWRSLRNLESFIEYLHEF